MNVDPAGERDGADFGDVGEIIRFDVVEHRAGVRVLHAVGELDTLTSPLLQDRIGEQLTGTSALVVDLTDISFLGSAGLAVLVGAKDAAAERSCTLWLVPGSRIARRALEATGLLSLFNVADDVEEALASAH